MYMEATDPAKQGASLCILLSPLKRQDVLKLRGYGNREAILMRGAGSGLLGGKKAKQCGNYLK
jgi:hypothetical protein